MSDHCSTICKFNKSEIENTIKFAAYRDFNNFDENFLFQNFHLIHWDQIYTYNDVNNMITFLNTNLIQVFESSAPLRNDKITIDIKK